MSPRGGKVDASEAPHDAAAVASLLTLATSLPPIRQKTHTHHSKLGSFTEIHCPVQLCGVFN